MFLAPNQFSSSFSMKNLLRLNTEGIDSSTCLLSLLRLISFKFPLNLSLIYFSDPLCLSIPTTNPLVQATVTIRWISRCSKLGSCSLGLALFDLFLTSLSWLKSLNDFPLLLQNSGHKILEINLLFLIIKMNMVY